MAADRLVPLANARPAAAARTPRLSFCAHKPCKARPGRLAWPGKAADLPGRPRSRPRGKTQSWAFYEAARYPGPPGSRSSHQPGGPGRQNVATGRSQTTELLACPRICADGLGRLRVVQPPKRNTGHSVRFNGVCRRYENTPKRQTRGIFAAVPRMVTDGGVFNFRTPRGLTALRV
ncbi:MAG: hypothetical protein KatS3mg038_0769 [Candidatus Kapaibacterium sp.]|nr:MAG: hypothetical protein KatS3mg038_0769 [Candidatus Kapabacteria bacterium]